MRRLLTFVVVISVVAAAVSGVVAQQVSGVPRVGVLNQGSPETVTGRLAVDEFREGMRSLGWIEGKTFSIEERFGNGDPARLAVDVAELAADKVDVIVAIAPAPARAARQATSTIPIVTSAADPNYSLVAGLARPACNVTGLSTVALDLVAKQLQLLKEAAPQVSKIGVLLQQDNPVHAQLITELERASPILGVSVFPVPFGPLETCRSVLTR